MNKWTNSYVLPKMHGYVPGFSSFQIYVPSVKKDHTDKMEVNLERQASALVTHWVDSCVT